jgi:hypothetical protein
MRRFVLPLTFAGVLLAASAASAATCVFTLSMSSGTDLNNLDLTVDYSGTDNGNVEGTATRPECVRAIGGQTFASFHDDDAGHKLLVSFIRLTHFSAPTPLAACKFFYDTLEPLPSDFNVLVTNAGRDGEDNNVVPLPVVAVSKVECPGELPEVTTTTSTTLLPDTTTTTITSDGDRCGFPITDGETPAASDALFALKAAVGGATCALCVCDVDDSGKVGAGDALAILRAAVGGEITLDCPAC